ncbi:hypothetical protein BCR39DRAFT_519099 [Naematelia encephala]|uniref:HIG1 domain-containing protein n=1 Tax=Naematelia encephala TaxID=71784 RepID=A0A1Y2BG28_9TREE|nr:hypothetical protein BCR39DRAFT_519099 [Naematelia encephala]
MESPSSPTVKVAPATSDAGGGGAGIDEWLPEDFKPMTFRKMIYTKLVNAPLVGVGILATVASFCMASYQMKLGNSRAFNYWLRWRVASQGATILAAVYYGGVAFTRKQQTDYLSRNLVMLGDYRIVRPGSESAETESPPPTHNEHYPLPVEERPRLSEFATRLRQAEAAHKAEVEAKSKGEYVPGSAQDKLRKRADKERELRASRAQAKEESQANEQVKANEQPKAKEDLKPKEQSKAKEEVKTKEESKS